VAKQLKGVLNQILLLEGNNPKVKENLFIAKCGFHLLYLQYSLVLHLRYSTEICMICNMRIIVRDQIRGTSDLLYRVWQANFLFGKIGRWKNRPLRQTHDALYSTA
jgi:hypothetical protein